MLKNEIHIRNGMEFKLEEEEKRRIVGQKKSEAFR